MTQVESFVFFDIETTGLPWQEKNQTKITDLAFFAITRKDIENTALGKTPPYSKLSLLLNPCKEIHPDVVSITGLSNALLEHVPTFKERVRTIISFLEDLQKPVCLVAHNGNIFDFKIILAEFKDAGASLPSDLFCADSLVIFRTLLKNKSTNHYTLLNKEKYCSRDILTDDENFTDDEDWPNLNVNTEEWQNIDEMTNILSRLSCDDTKKPKEGMKPKEIPKKDENICRNSNLIVKTKTGRVSYSLKALHKRLLNKDVVQEHRAEADCVMLLECVIAMKEDFLCCVNNSCKLLTSIKPLERY